MLSPTNRFSNRVTDYVRYRPGYPKELIDVLTDRIGFSRDWRVADVGSGTGNLTERFLGNGNPVIGIEPNPEMRAAGEVRFAGNSAFMSLEATAKATTLGEGSVDLVVAGQAFHWFEPTATQREFRRIHRRDGWVATIWNDRQISGTDFLDGYEQLLRGFPEYHEVGHRAAAAVKTEGFFTSDVQVWTMPTTQHFDWAGLLGRALSSSYVPAVGSPGHAEFVVALRALHDRTALEGAVEFAYETQMYVGRV